MNGHSPISIGDAVRQFLQENNLEHKISELHINDFWQQAVGAFAMPYTKSLEVREGTLYVKISNAALRNELFIRRFDIVKRVNDVAGYKIINDLRLS